MRRIAPLPLLAAPLAAVWLFACGSAERTPNDSSTPGSGTTAPRIDAVSPGSGEPAEALPARQAPPGPFMLAPALAPGMRFRHRISRSENVFLGVTRPDRYASGRTERETRAVIGVEILIGSKAALGEFRVTLDEISDRWLGGDAPEGVAVETAPTPGETWLCRGTDGDYRCVDEAGGVPRQLPAWFPVVPRGWLPRGAVAIGDTWSRGEEAAAPFGIPQASDWRGGFTLASAAGTLDGAELRVDFDISGTTQVEAFGTRGAAEVTGTGYFLFETPIEIIGTAAFDITVSREGSAQDGDVQLPWEHRTRIRWEMETERLPDQATWVDEEGSSGGSGEGSGSGASGVPGAPGVALEPGP